MSIKLADRIANLETQVFGGPNIDGTTTGSTPAAIQAELDALEADNAIVHNKRFHVAIADVNAGLVLLPLATGQKYRLIDVTLIAEGGNAGGATAVTITATQGASGVALITALVAALTRSAVVKPNSANVSVLADGASHALNDVSTGISIAKTGGSLTTSTFIDVILTYTLET